MGLQQSKDELVYQQVSYGNTDGIKTLRSEGAGLEWVDKEGKTPLIVACMNPELYNVAKTLIELGANVNAYRPGRHAGTPLHHAAKRGLEQIVKLLLSHGANPLLMNDDCQTPLDVARIKGYSNVVRAIESNICLFSGWLRELYGPGFLDRFAPQFLSRKVWVVIIPCGSRNLSKPIKLELAIYTTLQDAQPRSIIALWKANMDEPNFNQPDPAVVISHNSNIPRRWRQRRGIVSSQLSMGQRRGVRQARIKFAPASEIDKQELQRFCNACKGIPQVMHAAFPFNTQGAPVMAATAPPTSEDLELAMAISESLHATTQERPPIANANLGSGAHASTSSSSPIDTITHGGKGAATPAASHKVSSNELEYHEASSSNIPTQSVQMENGSTPTIQATTDNPITVSVPSAPPIAAGGVDDSPIHYPSIDFSPVDLSVPAAETLPARSDVKKDGSESSCVICLDAPVEGACIPCGHMAGCMSCLNEIKAKKWGCPVCRAKIDQVVRLYAV